MKDLNQGPVPTNPAEISKWRMLADPNSNDDTKAADDQFVRIRGQRGLFVVPFTFWKDMPVTQVAACEVFQYSKVIFKINGRNVREARKHRSP